MPDVKPVKRPTRNAAPPAVGESSGVDDSPERDLVEGLGRFRLRPSHRMLLALLVGLLSGAILVGGGALLLQSPNDAIDVAVKQVHPAQASLASTAEGIRSASVAFGRAFAESDPAARAPFLARALQDASRAEQHWSRYEHRSLDLPGEARLARRYRSLTDEQAERWSAAPLTSTLDVTALSALQDEIAASVEARVQPVRAIGSLYAAREEAMLETASRDIHNTTTVLVALYGVLAGVFLLVIGLGVRAARAEERLLRYAIHDRRIENQRARLESRIQRAFEMSRSEDAGYSVVGEAMRESIPHHALGEFLVADSSRAHFHQACGTGSDGEGPGCPVAGPSDCPATNTGRTLATPSSRLLDACPYLKDRSEPLSAICVPVAIAGRTIGVLHVGGEDGNAFGEDVEGDLELLARKAGERIGMIRAFARTETEARSDPLTGLLNRRSLENQSRRLLEEGRTYSVMFADLDHFKDLNTTFGHEAGDRALRLFSRTLRDSIRPDDLPARWGGEEFVVVLPDCPPNDAMTVAERLRERLARVLERGDNPAFTVSVGIASSEPGETFAEVVANADGALLLAKAQGRDRVTLSPEASAAIGLLAEAAPPPDAGVAPTTNGERDATPGEAQARAGV